MDLNTINKVIKRATKSWNKAPRNEIIHVRYNKSEVLLLQGKASHFWWQATIKIGSRGGFKGEFITMDPSQEVLIDQISYMAAPGGNSIGPLHIPKGGKRIEHRIRAAKSVLNQLLTNSRDEVGFAHTITKHRERVLRTCPSSSVRTVRG